MPVTFFDRLNNAKILDAYDGESIASVLRRNHIPCSSVITTCNNVPVSENTIVKPSEQYHVKLIEGYDIGSIIDTVFQRSFDTNAYHKRRVNLQIDGAIECEDVTMEADGVCQLVEDNIYYAIREHKLILPGEKILVGLSGGVDSSSLLIALSHIAEKVGFEIVAATFEDFDTDLSPTFNNAKKLAKDLGIEHHLIPADIVEKTFKLNRPIKQILPEIMNTKYRHYAMYADHHTTRRALEVYSKEVGADKIVLGLHVTDLVAGLLNSFTMGYYISDIYTRRIGDVTYIYPLMYISKKELHIYYYANTGRFAEHSKPNMWELNPKDRNYYYYLADVLQDVFPGIENYLYNAHTWKLKQQPPLVFTKCNNCGSHILQQQFAPVNEEYCDICTVFKELGFIDS